MSTPRRLGRILVTTVIFAGLTTTPTSFGGIRINTLPSQGGPDMFSNLVANAASFDMDSPVEAQAEFDPPTAPVGGHVIYRITVTALDESLKVPDPLPAPGGLEFRTGGRGQIYQPVPGMKVRPLTTINFHVTVLTNGVFTMPAFEVTAYSKPVKVPAATLKVAAEEPGAAAPPRLLVELPADGVYVGQTVKVPLILPATGDNSVHGISQARITGEFIFSEPISQVMRQENIRRNNAFFPAFVQEVLVTPLREGPQELIAQAYGILTRPVPGQTNAMQTVNLLVDSGPVLLTVKPLPNEGRLPGFTGAVGTYQIDPPKLSTNQVRAGEPVVLVVIVRGDGNVGRLTPPPFPVAEQWQAFPPIGENLPATLLQMRGFASFGYTLIPLSDQIKATPPIPFCYFDPKKKAYVNLTIPPLPLTVKPSPAAAMPRSLTSPDSAANTTEGDAGAREKELVLTGLLDAPGRAVATLTPLQKRWPFLALQLLPAAALGGLWGWDRRRKFMEEHPEVIRKRRARRGVRRQLRSARRAAATGDAAGFIRGATGAMREACAPHGAANPAALVCADVLWELPVSEQDAGAGEMVRRLFSAADAIRFGGPLTYGSDLLNLQPEFERVLDRLRARL